MNAAARIEQGVLVGIVRGTRPDQLRDERGLAAEAPPRDDDGAAIPSDHAGMDEDSAARRLRDVKLDARLEGVERALEIVRALETKGILIEQVEGTHAGSRAG